MTMANILLAAFIIVIAAAWRRSGYWTPWPRLAAPTRRRVLLLAGGLIVVLTLGFSLGDVLGGRTQISKDPVRYATRLQGAEAHHHDVMDAVRFWEQVLLQASVGLLVGGALILFSRPRAVRHRAAA